MNWPWSELGLEGPASLEEVRRAYARRVKEVHPEEDPEGFQRLHTAYQQARQAARQAKKAETGASGGGREREPRPISGEPEPKERDSLDVAALLRQEKEAASPPPPPPPPQEPELDFDALLSQEEAREAAREEAGEQTREPSWDFQRIFREEDARRAEQERSGGGQDEAVSRALELVELLFEEGRPHQAWERFFTSAVFFRVKWDPRFMAALAGAFQAEPVLDGNIRAAVCRAYGFGPGRVPQEHQAFYEAVSGGKAPSAKQKKESFRKQHPILFLLALFVGGILLLRTAVRLGIYLWELPDRQMAERLCQYIEEDYGYPVESQYAGHLTSAELFYLPVQQMSFTAWPEGERDPARGQLGYGTDLGNRMLTQELEDFAETWKDACELEMTDEEGGYLPTGEMPAIYAISTSLQGGTEFLTALAEEMDRLSGENWYRLWSPAFRIQLEAWNEPYFTYKSSDGPFPVEEILSCYEEVPVKLVARLVEECGLAEMDFGDRAYHMEDLGTVVVNEDNYVLVGGVEESTGQTTRLYLYNMMYLISVPPDGFDPNMSTLDYARILMGEKIPRPADELPWPQIGIRRD